MSVCKTLARASFSCLDCNHRINDVRRLCSLSLRRPSSIRPINFSNFWWLSLVSPNPCKVPLRSLRLRTQFQPDPRARPKPHGHTEMRVFEPSFPYALSLLFVGIQCLAFRELENHRSSSRCYGSVQKALSLDTSDEETVTPNFTLEPPEDSSKDTVEELLLNKDDVSRFMKMERRPEVDYISQFSRPKRWFPYLDEFKAGNIVLNSGEVLEALNPYIMEERKERFRNAVKNRSYSICLVVEGLSDYGNVSAAFRSADALGFQSVHVVSCDSSKRYRDNRHVSMGAEKWLDIELWNSPQDCFRVLKSRGYRIATTHLGTDAVSIYNMDWSCPTAIVVGNENRGISDEALELSDMHCSIPMKGMVESFNVSVAAGILMHHAVCDRTVRLGYHGDLTPEESQVLLAEFSLRHSRSAINIAYEYAKRKAARPLPKL